MDRSPRGQRVRSIVSQSPLEIIIGASGISSNWKWQGAIPMTIVHPRAIVATGIRLGRGVVVVAGAIVNSGSLIGDNAILNTACRLGKCPSRWGDRPAGD